MKCRMAWGNGWHGGWWDEAKEDDVEQATQHLNEVRGENYHHIEYQKECSHPNCSTVFVTEDREQEFCCGDCEELERDMIDCMDVAHNAREEER